MEGRKEGRRWRAEKEAMEGRENQADRQRRTDESLAPGGDKDRDKIRRRDVSRQIDVDQSSELCRQ